MSDPAQAAVFNLATKTLDLDKKIEALEADLAAARQCIKEIGDENQMLWAWSGEAFELFYEMHSSRKTNLTSIAVAVHTAPLRLRRRPQPQDGRKSTE